MAGTGGTGGYFGDGYTSTDALLHGPEAVAVDKAGNVYIVDHHNARVRKVFKSTGIIVTFAGNGTGGNNGDGSAATSAEIDPTGVAADMRGNVFISDANFGVVRKVNKLGIISRYAGVGTYGYSGNGGPATSAKLAAPSGLCTDAASNLYICDAANHVIRKVDTFGVITTVAGNDTAGYSGDGSLAIHASLDSPYAVAVDRLGNVYIADHNNNVIRMVDAATGIIGTIAGTAGVYGYTGDNGPATAATLNSPCGIAVDTSYNVFISDADNNVIRKIDNMTGVISTTIGNGFAGFGGDLGDPLGANLYHPYGIANDTFGTIYIADASNQRVRKVYNTTVGVHEVANNAGIEVYPNPIANEINVSGLSSNDKVQVYDLLGKAVSAVWAVTTNGSQTFTVGNLAAGVYVLQVTDSEGNKKATIKLAK